MRPVFSHSWNVSPAEAIQIQRELSARVITKGAVKPVRLVAGADISWDPVTGQGFAGVIVFTFPGFDEIERASATGKAAFPYVPGLLSFRETPLLLEAFARLESEPDLLFFDGQGVAHPRGFGIASHLGLLLGKPAIGCAKSLLVGEFEEPGADKGSLSPLHYRGNIIGSVLRTRDNVRPVFISPGHKLSLSEAVRLTLRSCDGYRVPRPTRLADRFVGQLRVKAVGTK